MANSFDDVDAVVDAGDVGVPKGRNGGPASRSPHAASEPATDLQSSLDAAIQGTEAMTEALGQLREMRIQYRRTFGLRQSIMTFGELDRALRALRKAARPW